MFRSLLPFSVVNFFFFLILSSGCHQTPENPPMIVPKVVVGTAVSKEVQPYIYVPGTTEAFEFVQIPARISGFLQEIRYHSGELVAAGDPLFLIQPEQYQAEVKAAEAELALTEAQLKLAEANLARTKSLIQQGAMTQQDLDTDAAKRDVAAADVMRAQAALDTAKLNLAYTDVRSPISGKTDKNSVDLGNLVGPGSGNDILTTVAGMDPIYVYFEISDYQFNSIREFAKENNDSEVQKLVQKLKEIKEKNPTHAKKLAKQQEKTKDESEKTKQVGQDTKGLEEADIEFEMDLIKGATPSDGNYPFKGIIDMTGNKINQSTGTIMIRGEIPNSDYTVFPGQICRVRLPIWKVPDAVLIRQEAIGTDLNQNYVYVYDESKKTVQRRVVKLGDSQPDGTRVVTEGLKAGDRYVVFGIQKVRDDMEVKTVSIEEFEKENKNLETKQVTAESQKTDLVKTGSHQTKTDVEKTTEEVKK